VPAHPACDTWVDGDVTDPADVERALGDAVAVVHTASVFKSADPGGVDLLRVNVAGTYTVLNVARRRSPMRVVLLSEAPVHLPASGQVPERGWRSSTGDDHLYDLSKGLQEATARDFCRTFGIDVIALRLGHVVDGSIGRDFAGHPLAELEYCRSGWVCCHDVARACAAAATSPDLHGFVPLPVIGATSGRERFGVDETERALDVRFREAFTGYDG